MLLYQDLFQHFVICSCQTKEANHFAAPEYFKVQSTRTFSKQRKYTFCLMLEFSADISSRYIKEIAILVLVYT